MSVIQDLINVKTMLEKAMARLNILYKFISSTDRKWLKGDEESDFPS